MISQEMETQVHAIHSQTPVSLNLSPPGILPRELLKTGMLASFCSWLSGFPRGSRCSESCHGLQEDVGARVRAILPAGLSETSSSSPLVLEMCRLRWEGGVKFADPTGHSGCQKCFPPKVSNASHLPFWVRLCCELDAMGEEKKVGEMCA